MFDRAVSGCFGETDLIFAGHPNDEERAFQWLTDLRQRSVGWKAARSQVIEYLEGRGASASHVQQQTEKVRRLFKPWLLD